MGWKHLRSFAYTPASIRQNAPAASGVYGIFTRYTWIYIGESHDIQARLLQHLNGDSPCIQSSGATMFSFELIPVMLLAARHAALVQEYRPLCNP